MASYQRKSSKERGYGVAHKRLRERWAKQVALGIVSCARCGLSIDPYDEWDLGHDDFDRSRYSGAEHATCNRSAGARQRHGRRPQKPKPPKKRRLTVRDW